MADVIMNHRYYLWGRDDAEERFDADDLDIEQLARTILDGADLRTALASAVDAQMAVEKYDGSMNDFIDEYAESLAEDLALSETGKTAALLLGTAYRSQVSELWAQWQRGFRDEATMALEDDVVDQMHDLVDDDDDVPIQGYSFYNRDGADSAEDAWDDDQVEEHGDEIVAKVDEIEEYRVVGQDQWREFALEVAERAYLERERDDRAKEQWMANHADEAKTAGLDPEVAYATYWRPAFVHETAELFLNAAQGDD